MRPNRTSPSISHPQQLTITPVDTWAGYTVLNSNLFDGWARKLGTTLESRLRCNPSDVLGTFPFPPAFSSPLSDKPTDSSSLDALGERLDVLRREVMQGLNIGLTKLYNAFHDPNYGDPTSNDPEPAKIQALRDLHRRIDIAVRDAYGWTDLDLGHGFHELEFLPENDRVRYTVGTPARKEILKRLLALNYERHAEEVKAGLVDETGKALKKASATLKARKKKDEDDGQGGLF